jgi:hypothetical protein
MSFSPRVYSRLTTRVSAGVYTSSCRLASRRAGNKASAGGPPRCVWDLNSKANRGRTRRRRAKQTRPAGSTPRRATKADARTQGLGCRASRPELKADYPHRQQSPQSTLSPEEALGISAQEQRLYRHLERLTNSFQRTRAESVKMEFRVPLRPTALSPGRGTPGRVCPEPQRAARPPNHLGRVSLAAVSRSAYAGTLQKAGPALGSLSPGECDLPGRLSARAWPGAGSSALFHLYRTRAGEGFTQQLRLGEMRSPGQLLVPRFSTLTSRCKLGDAIRPQLEGG